MVVNATVRRECNNARHKIINTTLTLSEAQYKEKYNQERKTKSIPDKTKATRDELTQEIH